MWNQRPELFAPTSSASSYLLHRHQVQIVDRPVACPWVHGICPTATTRDRVPRTQQFRRIVSTKPPGPYEFVATHTNLNVTDHTFLRSAHMT